MKMGEHHERWKTSSHADKIKKRKDNLENIFKRIKIQYTVIEKNIANLTDILIR